METEGGERRVIRQASEADLPPPPPTRASIPTSHHPAGVKRQGRVKHVFEEGGALI